MNLKSKSSKNETFSLTFSINSERGMLKLFRNKLKSISAKFPAKKEDNDEELIKKSLNGNLSAFEILVRRYQNMILRYCKRILNNEFDAEDATQETFLKIFTNLNKFDDSKLFKPWAYRIAHNTCYDIFRKNAKVTNLNWDVEYEAEPIIETLIKHDERQDLIGALKKLPEKYKTPLIEFYFKRLDYAEISQKLGLPMNTTRTRIRRGKLLLAEAID